jgi:hypothetical protein
MVRTEKKASGSILSHLLSVFMLVSRIFTTLGFEYWIHDIILDMNFNKMDARCQRIDRSKGIV